MFVSWKRLCKIAQEEAEAWRKIATDKEEYIEELLRQIKDLYNKQTDMYNYCCELKRDKDELFARYQELEGIARRAISEKDEMIDECLEMKAQLDLVIKQRDYYYDLLESTSEVEEKDE